MLLKLLATSWLKPTLIGLLVAAFFGGVYFIYKAGQDSIKQDQLEGALKDERQRENTENDLKRRSDDDLGSLLRKWFRD